MADFLITPLLTGEKTISPRLMPGNRSAVQERNPQPRTPHVARALAQAGSAPGGFKATAEELKNPRISFGVFLVLWVPTTVVFLFGESIKLWEYVLFTAFCFFVLYIAVRDFWRLTGGPRHYHEAFTHGWVNYYPALLSECWCTLRDGGEGSPNYYTTAAKARVILPDGHVEEIVTEDLDFGNPEHVEEIGCVVVESEKEATFARDNGWTLVACLEGKPLSQASVCHGLNEEQIEAGVNAALRPGFDPR